jgi:hypothetical protein
MVACPQLTATMHQVKRPQPVQSIVETVIVGFEAGLGGNFSFRSPQVRL